MIYLQLTIIAVIAVYIIDISGFTDAWTSMVSGWLTHGKKKEPFTLKPFTCSLCMSLWLTLLWVLIQWRISFFTIGYCFLMSYMAPTIQGVLINVQDALAFINGKINTIFNKNK